MEQRTKTRQMVQVGLLAAVVFAGNFFRIILPIDIGGTASFTLGNIACVLAGLLLGPVGGLSAGIGSALYDLTNPLYIMEVPFTFLNKAVMGLVAGTIAHRRGEDAPGYLRCVVAALGGALVYYVLYFIKSYFYNGLLVQGLPAEAALLALVPRIPTSLFNGGVAVVLAPPLARAILAALKKSGASLRVNFYAPTRKAKQVAVCATAVLALAIGVVSSIAYFFPKTPDLAVTRRAGAYGRSQHVKEGPVAQAEVEGLELLFYVSDDGLLVGVCQSKLVGYRCLDFSADNLDWSTYDHRAYLRGFRAGDVWVSAGVVLDDSVVRMTASGEEVNFVESEDGAYRFYYNVISPAPFNIDPTFKLYDAAGNELRNIP